VLDTVAGALVASPARRPSAGRLAAELRSLGTRRRPKSKGSRPARPAIDRKALVLERVLPATAAGATTAWIASTLPFYPPGSAPVLGAFAAAAGLMSPRLGLAATLAAGWFPLANMSIGLAVVYGVLAVCWLALSWRDARAGLLLVAGPLLAPLAALGLIPLAAQFARGRVRRALQAGAAVLLAGVVAGFRHARLPFDTALPPLGLGITGSRQPAAVASALAGQLAAHPVLVLEAVILGAAAAALPLVRRRGPWAASAFAAVLLAGSALAAPAAAVLPLIGAAWLTAAALTLETKP
jgi:hypothetical protein